MRHALLLAVLAGAAPAGCSTPAARSDELVVFAGSSLSDAFRTIGRDFEHAHPGVTVTFSFAGTQELRTQIEHGAPADVFAAADVPHMDALVRAGRAAPSVVFAHNEPVLVVAPDLAGSIRSLADLPDARRIVLGTPEVPIGRYTDRILERAATAFGADFPARVRARVVSRELSVRQVVAKVTLGEADAAIVYRTDALAAGAAVHIVSIPTELGTTASYPIATVVGAPHAELARAFVAAVRSAAGRRALVAAGFTVEPERGGSP